MRIVRSALTVGLLGAAPSLADSIVGEEDQAFDAWIGRYAGLDADGLVAHLGGAPDDDALPPLQPNESLYYYDVVMGLRLDARDEARLAREGMLVVPMAEVDRRHQRWADDFDDEAPREFTMAESLRFIYVNDLPLYVTADAVLDAASRSIDKMLHLIEERALLGALAVILSESLSALATSDATDELSARAAADAEHYLAVGLALLLPSSDRADVRGRLVWSSPELFDSALDAALNGEVHSWTRGADAPYDPWDIRWSLFIPRGSYAAVEAPPSEPPSPSALALMMPVDAVPSDGLPRWFRAMQWLGSAEAGPAVDSPRGLAAAIALTVAFARADVLESLSNVRAALATFTGAPDGMTPEALHSLLVSEGASGAIEAGELGRIQETIDACGIGRLREQGLVGNAAAMPLFGQRFAIDNLLLTAVAGDRVKAHPVYGKRKLPSGLDVGVMLGSPVAAELLRDDLQHHDYAPALAASEKVFATRLQGAANIADATLWSLSALSRPPRGAFAPAVLRGQPWARRMLASQLSSWAQSRHDFAAYTPVARIRFGCLYPTGYVEPYPEFWGRLERLARIGRNAARRLQDFRLPHQSLLTSATSGGPSGDAWTQEHVTSIGEDIDEYWTHFALVARTLRRIAEAQLDGAPLSTEDQRFLRQVVELKSSDERDGPYPTEPLWDGWYPRLLFGAPAVEVHRSRPTIAMVATNWEQRGLEVGTGASVDMMVVVIDNDGDQFVAVGPTTAYYELHSPAFAPQQNAAWRSRLSGPRPPARPGWHRPVFTGEEALF